MYMPISQYSKQNAAQETAHEYNISKKDFPHVYNETRRCTLQPVSHVISLKQPPYYFLIYVSRFLLPGRIFRAIGRWTVPYIYKYMYRYTIYIHIHTQCSVWYRRPPQLLRRRRLRLLLALLLLFRSSSAHIQQNAALYAPACEYW